MGKPTGFLEHSRELPQKIDPAERIKNNKEFVLNEEFGDKINTQASRCRIVVCRFVITAALSVTSSQSLTMRFIVIAGKKLGTF